jgi:hypothetical protein
LTRRSGFDKLRLIRAADKLLWPLALMVARLLAKLTRRRNEGRVLVRPGGMGDLICLHMAVLRLGLDPADFTWVVERRSMPWVQYKNLNYKLISPRLIFSVARYRQVINSEQHYGASQIISIALAGRKRQVTSFSTVRGASVSTRICPYSPIRRHEVQSFTDLLQLALGLAQVFPEYESALVEERRRLLVALGGGHAPSRRLTAHQWIQIIEKWVGNQEFDLISGPVEGEIAEQIEKVFSSKCTYLRGTFAANCEAIKNAKRVLTIDGGLTHVASFFGTPTDAIFTSGQVDIWAPLANTSRVFVDEAVNCRPCTMFGYTPRCPVDHICKRRLPDIIHEAI